MPLMRSQMGACVIYRMAPTIRCRTGPETIDTVRPVERFYGADETECLLLVEEKGEQRLVHP